MKALERALQPEAPPLGTGSGDDEGGRHGARRRGAPRRPGARLLAFVTAHRGDLLAAAAIVVLACCFVAPALVDGGSFGAFDLDAGRMSALGAGLFSQIHSFHNADSVSQMVSWNALDWQLVHHGHFPLWNDDSVLGMPLFLNFESAALSLPDLVSYLAPLPEAFLVAVVVKLVLAGTGVHAAARVLGCRPLSAFLGGATFMLSGPFANWVSWPLSDVFALAGWILAFAICTYRHRGKPWYAVGLALAVAFSFYGGFPEATILLSMVAVVALAVLLVALAARRIAVSAGGAVRTAFAALLGTLLAAPLLWPGLQVVAMSNRRTEQAFTALPLRTLSLFLAQGYYGMPIGSTTSFAFSKWNYYETVAYVGAVAVALALLALAACWRRPAVAALSAAVVFALAASYQPHLLPSLQELLNKIPPLAQSRLSRTRTVAVLAGSLLAAIGFEELLARWRSRALQLRWALAVCAVLAAVAYLAVDSALAGLTGRAATARFDSMIWPVALASMLAATAVALPLAARSGARPATGSAAAPGRVESPRAGGPRGGGPRGGRSRGGRRGVAGVSRRLGPPVLLSVASALLVGQVAELFFAGVGIPTYSDRFYPASAPERQLQRLVGGSLVGLDTGLPDVIQRSSPVGFYPEVNIGYGIRLFAAHDPLLPAAYFTTWPGPAPAPSGGPSLFFPDIASVALARRYGIGFILASPRVTVAPAGALPVAVLDGEHLYKVPGAARFSLQGPGTVAPTGGNGNGSFTITADPARREQIVLRVTDFPGWHLTSDGRPVALSSVEGVMESAVLPPGKQQLHLWYWPDRLTTGLVAAGVAAGLLVLWLLGWGETLARLARLGISVPDGSARTASGGGGRARR